MVVSSSRRLPVADRSSAGRAFEVQLGQQQLRRRASYADACVAMKMDRHKNEYTYF
jgi:hypothetical protein